MNDHYVPHSSGNLCCDTGMRSGGYDHDRECRRFDAAANQAHFEERQREFRENPPQRREATYTQAQVDALVRAERERAAKIPQEAAIRLMGGKRRVNQVDTHVSYVLTDIAKQILEGK